jgi:hypothetical protein
MQTQTLGQLFMSIAIVQYGVVPLIADLNSTHATNPRWSTHARFHVVSQVVTGASIAALAMYLLWSPSVGRGMGVCLATALSTCVLGAFFVSAACRSLYSGTLSDVEGGIPKTRGVDANAVNFGIAFTLLIVGRLLAM